MTSRPTLDRNGPTSLGDDWFVAAPITTSAPQGDAAPEGGGDRAVRARRRDAMSLAALTLVAALAVVAVISLG